MWFALGYIAGLATSAVIFSVLAAIKADTIVEKVATQVRTQARNAGLPVGGKGYILVPPDEDEEARLEIIEENNAAGRDTPISQLRHE